MKLIFTLNQLEEKRRNFLGHLHRPLTIRLTQSSCSGGVQNPKIFLNFSSGWVKVRLHPENQLHMLSGSALKVYVGGVGWGGVVWTN